MGETAVLEAKQIRKRFGHVEALRGAGFCAYSGEIVALIGDNGAGKSTLVKILSGALTPDSGEVLLDGKSASFRSPLEAQRNGIGTAYQDLALATELGSVENVYMGRELLRPGLRGRMGILDKRAMRAGTEDAFRQFGVRLKEIRDPMAALSGGQRQSVAICRAIMWAQRLVILDEPTAALGVVPTRKVLDLMRRARDTGVAIVLVSHNMQDVLSVADRIEVLRLGERVATFSAAGASVQSLVAAMTAGEST